MNRRNAIKTAIASACGVVCGLFAKTAIARMSYRVTTTNQEVPTRCLISPERWFAGVDYEGGVYFVVCVKVSCGMVVDTDCHSFTWDADRENTIFADAIGYDPFNAMGYAEQCGVERLIPVNQTKRGLRADVQRAYMNGEFGHLMDGCHVDARTNAICAAIHCGAIDTCRPRKPILRAKVYHLKFDGGNDR